MAVIGRVRDVELLSDVAVTGRVRVVESDMAVTGRVRDVELVTILHGCH